MSIGTSGRIVIEIDPEVKRQLHSALAREGLTLKSWFVAEASEYINSREQLSLAFPPNESSEATDGELSE